MAAKKGKSTSKRKPKERVKYRGEVRGIILIALGLLLMITLMGMGGAFGRVVSFTVKGLFSNLSYLLPVVLMVVGVISFIKEEALGKRKNLFFYGMVFLVVIILRSLLDQELLLDYGRRWSDHTLWEQLRNYFTLGTEGVGSGIIGMTLSLALANLFGVIGTLIITLTALLIGTMIYSEISLGKILGAWARGIRRWVKGISEGRKRKKQAKALAKERKRKEQEALGEKEEERENESKDIREEPLPGQRTWNYENPWDEEREILRRDQKEGSEGNRESPESGGKGLPEYAFSSDYYREQGTGSRGLQEKRCDETGKGLEEEPPSRSADENSLKRKEPGKTPLKDQPGERKNRENEGNFTEEELARMNEQNKVIPYQFPSVDLLSRRVKKSGFSDEKAMRKKARILEETLKNFGVSAKVIRFSKGPSITRYELQPETGVKVSKVVNLSDDIALNMAASAIRIEAPIPGKAAIGIEIPNDETSMVDLRSMIESSGFKKGKEKIPFALGRDVSGEEVIADIAKMPHLLIAGATGSGKSVCINTIILSILYGAKPDEVKLMLVDPKVVELNQYNGIPHLLIPVVTDPKKATTALSWAVDEMTKRYDQFAEFAVKDIGGYNEKFSEEKLPYIVIIIDELADLMMVAPAEVEDKICRIAQMARAAGIHLIIATQRPSVNVITGVIKANIPSRIAFSVASQVDSRTIIDTGGAEKLLGKGDMLFQPIGANKPKRIQGSFVEEREVENVVTFLKGKVEDEPAYQLSLLEEIKVSEETGDEPEDDLFYDAKEMVIEREQASVSMLQRKFKIGYNRAARLIDSLEDQGVIGGHEGSKPRKVLISKEEYRQELKGDQEESFADEKTVGEEEFPHS